MRCRRSTAICRCYIFSFDSLGNGHPRVSDRLSAYLRYEAADKLKRPYEDTCISKYKRTTVCLNSRDVLPDTLTSFLQVSFTEELLRLRAVRDGFRQGIHERPGRRQRAHTSASYLPVPYVNSHCPSVQTTKGGRWQEGAFTDDLREAFRERTLRLSEEWMKTRSTKENGGDGGEDGKKEDKAADSEQGKGKGKAEDIEVLVSDDDDVVIVSPQKAKPVKKGQGSKKKGEGITQKAARIR